MLRLIRIILRQALAFERRLAITDRPMIKPSYVSLDRLLTAIRACRACESDLPLGPRPILRASPEARILIVGHAPGARVHASGIPWDDASGDRLRNWLGIDRTTFDDESLFAIVPMGFCYPGRGSGGDNPPRPECAQLWLDKLLEQLPAVELTLLIGQYAQRHFLGNRRKRTLTETVKAWEEYAPAVVPLPHPSPRNQPWFKKHAWFEQEVLPALREKIRLIDTRGSSSEPAARHPHRKPPGSGNATKPLRE